MKILITGGSGFVARNLFEDLSQDHSVISLNSKELNLLETDKVFDILKVSNFDVVIHAATYDAVARFTSKDPSKVLENNLKMFFNIARCKDHFGKMIYFGSGAEFSREHWKARMKEDYFDVHVPTDQYGLSKYIMTKHAELSDNIYNLRIFGAFGKYDDWRTRFLTNACCRVVSGLNIKMQQNKIFDYIYVEDLAGIVRWLISSTPRYKVYNACSGKTHDFKTLAEKLIKVSGKNLDIEIEKEGIALEYSGDNSRLMNELKDFRFTPINEAIGRVYDWHNENRHLIEIEKL